MSVDVSTLVIDRYYIDQITKDIQQLSQDLAHRWQDLQRKCTHPTSKTIEKYNSGGYDYVSSVHVLKTCTICDKVLESYDDPKHHGSFA